MSLARTVAIVPAAGYGSRLALKTKKPFVLLKGKPIIAHTLEALERCKAVDEIVIASESSCVGRFKDLVRRYRFGKVSGIVIGGKTRFESVKNCLMKIGPSFDIVIVHDGARPFVDDTAISESVRLARKFGACIVGTPETDTVKLVDKRLFIKKTLNRNRIFRAETPQVFKYDIIKKAYATTDKAKITDDAGLVEHLGMPVKILIGTRNNMKITTKEDLRLAEALL
ncbi:MAG: 2-C-methyl-D-erythritol 4-phosphate cytidylyltransferase [Candidatus Omnitrophica bacterium]|nr:2-C-methyl-D-erythritol 4-phosphate cytidylyltransferase [Candidatus Omnitrophota bacterium]